MELLMKKSIFVNRQDSSMEIKSTDFIGKSFEITNLGGISHYLGMDVTRDRNNKFELSQPQYIQKIIDEAGQTDAKVAKSPMDTGYLKLDSKLLDSNEEFRKLIGMLLYLTTNTRPDIAASVSILSKRVTNPREHDMVGVKRVIRYLKGTKHLKLSLCDEEAPQELHAYSDANWAEDQEERKSNSGHFISLNGGSISWRCKKQEIIALSSAESEYIALTDVCKELTWIKEVLRAFDITSTDPTTVLTDSQSCISMIRNQRFSHRSKHIDVRYHYLKQQVEIGNVQLKYVPTEHNTADLMTKPLGPIKTQYLRGKAGLHD